MRKATERGEPGRKLDTKMGVKMGSAQLLLSAGCTVKMGVKVCGMFGKNQLIYALHVACADPRAIDAGPFADRLSESAQSSVRKSESLA